MIMITLEPIISMSTNRMELHKIGQALINRLKKKSFIIQRAQTVSIRNSADTLQIILKGIATNNETDSIVRNIVLNHFRSLGLYKITQTFDLYSVTKPKDTIFTKNLFTSMSTTNETLLQHYLENNILNETDIPEQYKDSLTHQVMDTPIFIHDRKDTLLDKETFFNYLFSQKEMISPFTRLPIDPQKDITVNRELKKEINQFVIKTVGACHDKSHRLFSATFKKYLKNEEPHRANVAKAFRNAAHKNDPADLQILYNRLLTANATDQNPKRKYTALHWAVRRNAIAAVEFLLNLPDIDVTLKNAAGRTPLELARKINNNQIAELLENFQHKTNRPTI